MREEYGSIKTSYINHKYKSPTSTYLSPYYQKVPEADQSDLESIKTTEYTSIRMMDYLRNTSSTAAEKKTQKEKEQSKLFIKPC